MTFQYQSDIISHKEFNELRLIAALSDPHVKYLRQQGWDPLTLALGLGPKNKHACGRFASHRRLPVNLDTIRTDAQWKTKSLQFLDEVNGLRSRKDIIFHVYSRILKEIWAPQVLIVLQRRFRNWTYRTGNPGYLRLRASLSKTDDPDKPRMTDIWSRLLCCKHQTPQDLDPDHDEWSD